MFVSDWCAIATMSSRNPIKDMPFANIFSFSDGLSIKESTGIPYLYLNRDEMSVQDIIVSQTISLATADPCLVRCNMTRVTSWGATLSLWSKEMDR